LTAFFTYTSNWFVDLGDPFYFAWSLATEEQLYSLWSPVLVAGTGDQASENLGAAGRVDRIGHHLARCTLVAETSVVPARIPASL
jgi:peptidoglycan/LPS O-acetylase OafA/YrhL